MTHNLFNPRDLPVHVRARLRHDRKERELDKAFDTLVTTPHDFGTLSADSTSITNLSMPAGSRLAIAVDTALDPSDVTINIAGASLGFTNPALAADQIHRGVWAEENMVVSVTRELGCPAGAFTLYQVDAQGLHRTIGTATFSV